MNYSFINTNFTAGEISPRLLGRTDVARYNNGAKVLENVIPLIHGGVMRRPGLRYVATSKDSTKACRLLKFTYNTDQSYIIELGDLYARFYNDAGAQIESSPGVPYEIVTPYTAAQIWQVDYCQGADTMFLFHPDFAPYRIQRFADDNWRIMLAPIDPEPFDELGILASMACTLSSAAVGASTFTAASAVFLASDVGRQITSAAGIGTITAYTSTTVVTVNITSAFPSTSLLASSWTIEGSPQTSCTPSAKDPVGATITLTLAAAGWRSDDVGRFVNINGGLCKITAYTSATVVSAQIRTELAATVAAEANAWFIARSMWGGANGYPRTGSLFQQRLFVGGSYGFPQSVWFSELGNPYSFEIGAEADSAYEMRLVSDQANPVLNLASSRAVLALTSGTEFSLGGDGGVSPATITAINQSSFGSSDVTPCRLGNELLFVNRSGLKIRAMAADRFDSNQYAAPDITALSEHITESGIVEIDAQTDPENILWCVRNDGQIATCTLDRDNEVVAWARQITQGLFESVCVVPFGYSYSVWVVVQRIIEGVAMRYIERFDWNVSLDSALSGSTDPDYVAGDEAQASSPPSDPYFANVTHLLHFDGVYGSNTLVNEAGADWVITAGVPQIKNDVAKFSSALVSTTAAGSNIKSPASIAMGTDDFTVDIWYWATAGGTVVSPFIAPANVRLNSSFAGSLEFGTLASRVVATGITFPSNTWFLLTLEKRSGILYCAVNGVFASNSIAHTWVAGQFEVSILGTGAPSYADELRLTQGVARYGGDFTPPNTPFPDVLGSGLPDFWNGIDHLEGLDVQVLGDGILQTDKTVTAGAITIDTEAVYLDVGLPYTHKVVTLSPEIQGPTGTIQGRIQRAYEVALLLKDTIGATVNGTPMSFQTFGPTVLDVPIEPFTGWKDVGLLGYDTVNEITITSSDPLPFHLLAVVRRVDIGAWP